MVGSLLSALYFSKVVVRRGVESKLPRLTTPWCFVIVASLVFFSGKVTVSFCKRVHRLVVVAMILLLCGFVFFV